MVNAWYIDMTKTMTCKNAKAICKKLGFKLTKPEDFRLVPIDPMMCYPYSEEDVAYYTDDLQDIVDTTRNWR